MLVIKYQIPTLSVMPKSYSRINTQFGVNTDITVIVRFNDTYYHPDKLTEENVVESRSPFGNSIFLEELKDISSYAVAEYGIFYVKYKEGLFYLHNSGTVCCICKDSDICNVSYNNRIVETYKVQEVRQVVFNEHHDTSGYMDEEWLDKYKVDIQAVSQFSYVDILKFIYEHDRKIYAEYDKLHPEYDDGAVEFLHFFSNLTFEVNFGDIAKGEPYKKVSDDVQFICVYQLFYKNKLVGYRFKTNSGYFDMSIESAEKYGLVQKHVSMKDSIELIRIYQLLISKSEIGDMFAEDISNCEADCKKLIQLFEDSFKKAEKVEIQDQKQSSVLIKNQDIKNKSDITSVKEETSIAGKKDQTVSSSSIFCMSCGQELPVNAKFCLNCGSEVRKEEHSSNSVIPTPSNGGSNQDNSQMTLLEFRQNASQMTGYREVLLEYRKSLSNSWDYNAYVGILLGVGGSKHGDVACTNFAIGQGDNGNNTKKTLEAKGLISVFEKYKGKKVDASILLSDVEDEIVLITPEYASIRQKFHEIVLQKRNIADNAQKVDSVVPSVKNAVKDKQGKQESEEMNVLKYLNMPSHDIYYTFPGYRVLRDGKAKKDPGCVGAVSKQVIQEQDGKLYYVENADYCLNICELSIYGLESKKILMTHDRASRCGLERGELDRSIFHLGIMPRFSVCKNVLYYSRPQAEGRREDNNHILSFNIDGSKAQLKKSFELSDPKREKTLYSPYVLGNSTLASVFSENGFGSISKYLISKDGTAKCIYKYGEADYLSINEQECIIDSGTDTAVYNFKTGQKTSLAKAYKGSKNKDVLFINSQKDILYYFENENDACGRIIGISKSGEIVDEWEPITDKLLVDRVKKASGYSSFSFDGNLRIFKTTAELKGSDDEFWYEDCIYTVDRNGNVEERFHHQYYQVEERFFSSALHIQTPNTVIVHFEEEPHKYVEYMITTKGDCLWKPLF